MIQKVLESAEWTSASPVHINRLIQVNAIESPDFEQDIKDLLKEQSEKIISKPNEEKLKMTKTVETLNHKVKGFEDGFVGEVHNFTSEQFGNVKALASNPSGFILQSFMKKFAKGAGVIALALIIFEAVQWIISELMKPGRMLDIRFRRNIEREILAFRSREEKQKLNQGMRSVVMTSIGGLRGGSGQTFSSYRTVAGGTSLFAKNYIDPQLITDGSNFSTNKYKKRF